MTEENPQFTPVNLLTGFLGSGKTTLLQRLLRDPALADTAVLINEFGEVGLDHHLLERIDDRTVLLQSGCLCCTIRGELSDAMRDLHSRRTRGTVPAFRRLVIESTGLADPFPVLTTIHADPVLKHHFVLGNVIATVDAVNGLNHLARQPESLKQAAVADRLVVTKSDITDEPTLEAVMERLSEINPDAPIIISSARLDPDTLLGGAFDPEAKDAVVRGWFKAELAGAPHRHGHDPNRHRDIAAFALVFERPIDWTVFGVWLTMLLNRHGDKVLRVKGILNLADEAAPVAVHGVQHLVHSPVHLSAWPDGERRSRVVFIVQGLTRGAIEQSLFTFAGLLPAPA